MQLYKGEDMEKDEAEWTLNKEVSTEWTEKAKIN